MTRPYGRDMAVRDPFGNQIRMTQYLDRCRQYSFEHFSGTVDFGCVLSVVATSVYGMDHTGDNPHHDVEPGHDAGPDADAESGDDMPVESGHRSHALLAELAEAER